MSNEFQKQPLKGYIAPSLLIILTSGNDSILPATTPKAA